MQLRSLAGARFFFFFFFSNWSTLIKVYVPQSCGGFRPYGRKSSHQREWFFFVIILPLPTTSWQPSRGPLAVLFCTESPAEFQRRRLVFMQIVSCNIYASWGRRKRGNTRRSRFYFSVLLYFLPRVIFVLLFSSRHTPIISPLIRSKFLSRVPPGANYRILARRVINNIPCVMRRDTADIFQRRSDRCRFKSLSRDALELYAARVAFRWNVRNRRNNFTRGSFRVSA